MSKRVLDIEYPLVSLGISIANLGTFFFQWRHLFLQFFENPSELLVSGTDFSQSIQNFSELPKWESALGKT